MDQNEMLEMNTEQPPEHYLQQQLHQPPPPQNCPRCYSTNTKFCYYNNYSHTQPRYLCKTCRRYWTHGGTLRNVPVGGGTRKNKRSKTSGSTDILTTQSSSGSQNYASLETGHVYQGYSNTFIPQLAAVQSFPTVNNQGAALSLHGSCAQVGASVAHFQGMNISSFNQSLIPPRPLGPWILNTGPTTSLSAGQFSFWSGTTNINGGAQEGSSLINPYRRWETGYNKPSN